MKQTSDYECTDCGQMFDRIGKKYWKHYFALHSKEKPMLRQISLIDLDDTE